MDSHTKDRQPPIPLHFTHKGTSYTGLVRPQARSDEEREGNKFDIFIEDNLEGVLERDSSGWRMDRVAEELANAIGEQIEAWYQKNSASGRTDVGF